MSQDKIAAQVEAMIDSGATGLFIDKEFAEHLKLKQFRKKKPVKLTLFDGSSALEITHQVYATFEYKGIQQKLRFEVTKLSHFAIVLGLPWLKDYNPNIDWGKEAVEIHDEGIALKGTEDIALEQVVPEELHEFLDVFSEEEAKALPPHRPWDMKINLMPGAKDDHKGRIYNLSPEQLKAEKEWIDEHLAKGFIRPSNSQMTTCPFFVKKKDDSGKMSKIRLVVDYRYLNDITIKDRYPIPLIGNLTDQLAKAKFFTKMDLRYGYHLVRIAEGDEWKTAFSTRHGQFEYTVMPLGLCNAPAVFQRMMNTIFHDMLDQGCVIYLDDILIYAETEEELLRITREVLKRLREHKLFVKPGKCRFKVQKVEFLGVIIFPGGLEMDPGKTDTIRDWPAPTKLKELQSFLGFCNFYRRFIQGYSKIARPLNDLIGKNAKWLWTKRQQEAFMELKAQFKVGKVLMHPKVEKQFFIECDSSGYAMGAELFQINEEGKRQPVAFFSKTLQPAERNYDIHDKELLVIVKACQQWRHYLEGAPFKTIILSDHKNLEIFRTTKVLTPRQARWAEFLAGLDFVIQHQPGTASARTDAISCRPDFKPEDKPELVSRIFTDEMFLKAITTVNYENEYDILSGVKQLLDKDDTVAPQLTFLRSTRKDLDDWSLKDGFLRKKGKIYVPNSWDLRKAVLWQHHDTFVGGHRGPKATQEFIQRKYYWPGMAKMIEEYCQGCDTCQRTKTRTHAPYGPLLPLKTPDRKWTHISYDFITGLPESEGKDTILVVVDRFSKGIHLIACKEEGLTADVAARLFLDNVWKLHGTPEHTVSDRGVQFNNQFLKRLYELLGIKPSFSTAYHPETDGQTERMNQAVEHFLRVFTSNRQDDWVKLLPMAEFSYNNHANASTGTSPFFLWYGEHPVFEAQEAREEFVPAAEELSRLIKEAGDEAKAAIKLSQVQHKEQADKHRKEAPEFEIGEEVWVNRKNMTTHRPSKKLDWKYIGPYKILAKIGKRAYKLDLPRGINIHPVFHVNLLEKKTADNFDRDPVPVPPITIDGEEEWEVDKILNSRWYRGKPEYLIRWKGFSVAHNSWEPQANVSNAKEALAKFHNENPLAAGSPGVKKGSARRRAT